MKHKKKGWTKILLGGPGDGHISQSLYLGDFASYVVGVGKCAHYKWILVDLKYKIAVGKYTRKNLGSNK